MEKERSTTEVNSQSIDHGYEFMGRKQLLGEHAVRTAALGSIISQRSQGSSYGY